VIAEYWRRLKFLWRSTQFERELEEEMRLHVQLRAEQLGDLDAARRRFGNPTLLREQSRDQWTFRWLDNRARDFVYAVRTLRKRPGFSLAVIGTLAIGLGLNTAIFTLLNGLLLRPLAVRDPHSLYQVALNVPARAEFGFGRSAFEELRARTDVFTEVLAIDTRFTNLDGRAARGAIVSGNYFSMLGGGTAMGRPLQSTDTDGVLVLSHRAWRKWYGSNDAVLGTTVTVGRHRFEVIGVARPEFAGVEPLPDFWATTEGWQRTVGDRDPVVGVVGRLRPGVTPKQATAALTSFARAATQDRDDSGRAQGVELRSKATMLQLPPRLELALLPLLAAIGLTLAIPCANVTNMVLARGLARQREIGIRLSLGASRGRVVLQLLTEGLVMACAAGLLGLVVARGALEAALAVMIATTPPSAHVMLEMLTPDLSLDWRVFSFVAMLAAVTTIAFSLAPAVQATRVDPSSTLRGDVLSMRASRLRDGMVVLQVSASLLFLVSAMVMARGLQKVSSIDLGYDGRGVFSLAAYTPLRVAAIVAALEQEPWVDAVAHRSPDFDTRVVSTDPSEPAAATYSFVSGNYFDVFRIRIDRGRAFTNTDASSGTAVAVLSKAAADRLWPGQEALGRTLRIDAGTAGRRKHARIDDISHVQVIGIANNTRSRNVTQGIDPVRLYLPARTADSAELFIRGRGDSEATARHFQDAWKRIAAADESATVFSIEQRQYWDTYPARASTWLASLLSAIALVLTVSGIYGVISFLVSQRRRDIGIQIALGASRATVVRWVAGQSGRLIGIGIAVGMVLAMAVSKVMWSRTPMVDPLDAVAYVTGLAIVAGAAVLASIAPALRAMRVDPVVTLKAE
jgi:predicted permease